MSRVSSGPGAPLRVTRGPHRLLGRRDEAAGEDLDQLSVEIFSSYLLCPFSYYFFLQLGAQLP